MKFEMNSLAFSYSVPEIFFESYGRMKCSTNTLKSHTHTHTHKYVDSRREIWKMWATDGPALIIQAFSAEQCASLPTPLKLYSCCRLYNSDH